MSSQGTGNYIPGKGLSAGNTGNSSIYSSHTHTTIPANAIYNGSYQSVTPVPLTGNMKFNQEGVEIGEVKMTYKQFELAFAKLLEIVKEENPEEFI